MPQIINGKYPPMPSHAFTFTGAQATRDFMPALRYVYCQIMMTDRGEVGYDYFTDQFILYLDINDEDRQRYPILSDTAQIWVSLTGGKEK